LSAVARTSINTSDGPATGGGTSPSASTSVVEETKRSLAAHELIKVRIETDDGAQRRTVAEELARVCDAEVAGSIGKLAILYRARDEDPEIELP